MALASPNTLGGLTRVRDHLAENLGVAAWSLLTADAQTLYDDFIELALDEIATECRWTWLRRESQFTTFPGYSTGTVTVTQDSGALTGSGTSWNSGTPQNLLADDKFLVGTEAAPYRVSGVTGATAATMVPNYAGATTAGATYQSSRDEIELATGCWWLRTIRELATPNRLEILSYDAFVERTRGDVYRRGRPEIALMLGADTSAVSTTLEQKIQLWPAPDARYAFSYTYHSLPTWPANNFETHPQAQGLLLAKALSLVWAARQSFEQAAYWEKRYDRLLPKFMAADVSRANTKHVLKPLISINVNRRIATAWPYTVTEP